MFTGIVSPGRVVKVSRGKASAKIRVDIGSLAKEAKAGDSIAVNGVCLTVEKVDGNVAEFSVIGETLRRSNLGMLKEGDVVDIEASMKAGDKLGGHIVQGHIDGTGRIAKRTGRRGETELEVECRKELTDMMVEKGSVAVDGMSLTIGKVADGRFSVYLIPHTLANTALGIKEEGDIVNIETDIMGKYVKRMAMG